MCLPEIEDALAEPLTATEILFRIFKTSFNKLYKKELLFIKHILI
jgi:hypothetical protein